MNDYLKNIKVPETVVLKPIRLSESFMDFAGRLADEPGTVLLASGGHQNMENNKWDCSRYHILAARPWLTIKTRGNRITLTINGHEKTFTDDPLALLQRIMSQLHFSTMAQPPNLPATLPVTAGLFGYFAYDAKDGIETLPKTCVDDLYLPDIYLVAPRLLIIHDRQENLTTACVPVFSEKIETAAIFSDLDEIVSNPTPPTGQWQITSVFSANFKKEDYKAAVSAIIDYIAAGDVYQVNLSQRFETDFTGRPWPLFIALFQKNPAAFFAYINAGDHHILSTSPERFIKQNGKSIETRPIKGTRPRGKTPAQDEKNRQELLASTKDDAELSMIVDLLRNDIGKVCQPGSVRVTEHKRLEAYDNVFHLVSIVEGQLKDSADAADIIAATFPGGSITGCPKIRAMEIIDELEPCRRHIYTGSIGYISFHDTMDLSIAIRTATICGEKLFYSAGGGIVYDSNPTDEFDETLAKAATMLDAFTSETPVRNQYVWLNGKLTPETQAAVPLNSPGFQYGAGLFETIRADNGKPGFLEAHIDRLTSSWQALFSTPAPDVHWQEIIQQLLVANDLTGKTASVKIMAAHGNRDHRPFSHTLAVIARPYTHRLNALNKTGLDLVVYPQPRQIMTAGHKTLNYFFYHQAGIWARRNNADEALIINPDKTISETNTANLMLINGNTITVPQSPTVLNGVMQTVVLKLLEEKGFQVVERKVALEDCLKAEAVILTNSLMGAVPALSLDNHPFSPAAGLCREINQVVLAETSA